MSALVLSFGAIAEARVRQHRRRLAGGLALLLLVSGLGAYALLTRHHSTSGVLVEVVLTHQATQIQEDRITDAVGRAAQAGSVRRISAEQGLAMMARQYPNLVKGLPNNPLSTMLRFRVAKADLASAEEQLQGLPGVQKVLDH